MGAPQSRILELCKELKKRNWDVLVITSMPNYPTGKIFESYKKKIVYKELIEGFCVIRFPIYPSNSRKIFPRIVSMFSFSLTSFFSILRIYKFKPEFIITESPPLTLAFTGIILSRLSNAKHIMNVSDIWPLSAYELGALSKGKLYNFLEKFEKWTYKNSYACMGQSQEILDHVNHSGSSKAILFRNGVNANRFVPRAFVTRNCFHIVYMGLLGVAQGILHICQSINFKELGFEFHIYGQGPERSDIETYLVEFGLKKSIFLHEPISREEVPVVLSTYDLTIIPLIKPIRGAIPSKIYEAMAAGVPIVFCGGGEGEQIVKEHNVGWSCTPSDFDALVEVLTSIKTLQASDFNKYKSNCMFAAKNIYDRRIQIDNLENWLLCQY